MFTEGVMFERSRILAELEVTKKMWVLLPANSLHYELLGQIVNGNMFHNQINDDSEWKLNDHQQKGQDD
jgi:hypothetical protein